MRDRTAHLRQQLSCRGLYCLVRLAETQSWPAHPSLSAADVLQQNHLLYLQQAGARVQQVTGEHEPKARRDKRGWKGR